MHFNLGGENVFCNEEIVWFAKLNKVNKCEIKSNWFVVVVGESFNNA